VLVRGRSEISIPIPGFKNAQQAEENARALAFGPLRPEQMEEIDMLLGSYSSACLYRGGENGVRGRRTPPTHTIFALLFDWAWADALGN